MQTVRPAPERASPVLTGPVCAIGAGAGLYVLVLDLKRPTNLAVGRLGRLAFNPGLYGYVGSAFGPGGLTARIGRHVRGGSTCRWHVDYLRQAAVPAEVWIGLAPRCREHDWALLLGGLAGAAPVAPGFGTSDCRCATHLFYFGRRAPWPAFDGAVSRRWPEDGALRRIRQH